MSQFCNDRNLSKRPTLSIPPLSLPVICTPLHTLSKSPRCFLATSRKFESHITPPHIAPTTRSNYLPSPSFLPTRSIAAAARSAISARRALLPEIVVASQDGILRVSPGPRDCLVVGWRKRSGGGDGGDDLDLQRFCCRKRIALLRRSTA